MTGCALLVLALAPDQPTDFPTHVRQHLIVGMLAPTVLVMGGPVTLLLRGLPTAAARRLTRILHLPVRLLTHPVTALILSSGSLAALTDTVAAMHDPRTIGAGLRRLAWAHGARRREPAHVRRRLDGFRAAR